jgi:TolA-binding protein
VVTPSIRRIAGGWVAGLCAVLITGAALAQTPLDDPLDDHSAKRLDKMEKVVRELRAIIFQGRETGTPVVIQPAETQGQINALTDKVNDLEHTLTRLNGEMEVVRHDLDQSRQDASQLRAENADLKAEVVALEQKVQALTAPPPAPPSASGPAGGPSEATQDPAGAFAAAKAMLGAGDTAGAEAGFKDYVDRFGDTPQGPEARYYFAKTLLARKAYADAASADIGAIRGWPQTRWAADAVLDLSHALMGLEKPSEACETLAQLPKHYPQLSPAVRAGVRSVRLQAKCE